MSKLTKESVQKHCLYGSIIFFPYSSLVISISMEDLTSQDLLGIKLMFSKKATKIDKIFTMDLTLMYLVNVKSTVKILSIFVAFLENMNFITLKKTLVNVIGNF